MADDIKLVSYLPACATAGKDTDVNKPLSLVDKTGAALDTLETTLSSNMQYVGYDKYRPQGMQPYNAFRRCLEVQKKTERPLLLIYGCPYNTGMNSVMDMASKYPRGGLNTWLAQFSQCREKYDGNVNGFMHCYYCDDGSCEEANEVKRFIAQYEDQYGKITTGYPWYMVYQKKADGSVYARYGSLAIFQSSATQEADIQQFAQVYRDSSNVIKYEFHVVKPKITFTVVFKDYDRTVLKEAQEVEQGEDAVPPENPTREGYVFTGWNPDCKNVTSDRECMAQYVKDTRRYENPRRVSEINRDTTLFQY